MAYALDDPPPRDRCRMGRHPAFRRHPARTPDSLLQALRLDEQVRIELLRKAFGTGLEPRKLVADAMRVLTAKRAELEAAGR